MHITLKTIKTIYRFYEFVFVRGESNRGLWEGGSAGTSVRWPKKGNVNLWRAALALAKYFYIDFLGIFSTIVSLFRELAMSPGPKTILFRLATFLLEILTAALNVCCCREYILLSGYWLLVVEYFRYELVLFVKTLAI